MLTVRQSPDKATAVVALEYGDDMLRLWDASDVHNSTSRSTLNAVSRFQLFTDERKYAGITSLDAARALITGGWTDGAQRAATLAQALTADVPAAQSIRAKWEYGADGDDVSVERAMRGDWDVAYSRRVKVQRTGTRLLTLGANFGGHAGRNADELFWNGVQLIVATDVLEQAGYRVEARGLEGCGYRSSGARGLIDVLIKRPEEPLRVDAAVAVLAHAGVYRTYGFAAICRLPWAVDMGLGTAEEARPIAETLAGHGLLAMPDYILPMAYSHEQAVQNITALIGAVSSPAGVA